jgi:hypothetical protein
MGHLQIKSWSYLFVKIHVWLVTQVATYVSLPSVRICGLFYQSNVVQVHLLLYLLIDYIYRHSII